MDGMINMEDMSDEELQEAFAAGLIKPGLNIPVEKEDWKVNVFGMKEKLKEFELKLDWIERMDLSVKPAPMAPELHYEISDLEKNKVVHLKNFKYPTSTDNTGEVLNDFKREMLFYRQAQSSVVEGIAKLKQLGVQTRRPDDYFAQMAKSDEHMQKVRENLAARKAGAQRSEHVKELRRLKKIGKQKQIESKLQQQKEKKVMLEQVKKYRKGIRKNLDFLDKKSSKGSENRSLAKKKYKDAKYGFGGKKRGSKGNTWESTSEMTSLVRNHNKGPRAGMKMSKGKRRLGKSKRTKKKSKKN